MATEREVQETIARCVSTIVFYQNCEPAASARERMVAEFQIIARSVERWGPEGMDREERFCRTLENEMVARYGPELGARLAGEFHEAFVSSMARGH